MPITFKVSPPDRQDPSELRKGLLLIRARDTSDPTDFSIDIFKDHYSIRVGDKFVYPVKLKNQDKLDQGVLKVNTRIPLKYKYINIQDIDWIQRYECFVATAVYKDPFAPQVESLQWLRANVLEDHPLGSRFVDRYQNGLGQRLADIVENHPWLRTPSRALLDLAAKGADYIRQGRV